MVFVRCVSLFSQLFKPDPLPFFSLPSVRLCSCSDVYSETYEGLSRKAKPIDQDAPGVPLNERTVSVPIPCALPLLNKRYAPGIFCRLLPFAFPHVYAMRELIAMRLSECSS